MFLAIINDTYSEVKAEIALKRNEFEIGDYFKVMIHYLWMKFQKLLFYIQRIWTTINVKLQRGYNNVMGRMGARNKNIDIENALRLANADGIITYEEIRQNLKKYEFCF